MRRPGSLALACLLGASPVWAGRFNVVVEGPSPEAAALVKALRSAGGPGEGGALFDMSAVDLANPVEKGVFLARLAKAQLLVPVGEGATRFVARELEETPTFFVGAAVVEGGFLAGPNMAGILGVDPQGILQAAAALGLRRVALAYTPGYVPLADRIAALARPAGIELRRARVDSAARIVPVLQDVFPKVDAVWVLGDPILARGAGFEFLVEESLARKVPVISPTAWGVGRGALFCLKIDFDALAGPASAGLKQILAQGIKLPERRLETASGGTVVFNGGLMRRWGYTVPQEGSWRSIQ